MAQQVPISSKPCVLLLYLVIVVLMVAPSAIFLYKVIPKSPAPAAFFNRIPSLDALRASRSPHISLRPRVAAAAGVVRSSCSDSGLREGGVVARSSTMGSTESTSGESVFAKPRGLVKKLLSREQPEGDGATVRRSIGRWVFSLILSLVVLGKVEELAAD